MRDAHDHRQELTPARAPRAAAADRSALHVAALPFPTHQGTQAVIRAMLEALAEAGRPSDLLAYAGGERAAALPFTVHRAPDLARDRSLRSGPSARKLVADAALAVALVRRLRAAGPDVIVAHHVEAALITRALAPRRAVVFFAHTDLEAELPDYFAPRASALLARAGRQLDRQLVRRAGAVAAISPLLADRLAALPDAPEAVHYVPPPWPLPPVIHTEERARARVRLGLPARAKVILYAGNLDRYQGWETIAGAVARLAAAEPELRWLVGTESDPAELLREAQRAGIAARVEVRPLAGEAARRALHAAADVVAIPRKAPGGLPIKLLDALARGLPCAAVPRALAGIAIGSALELAAADDPAALAASLEHLLGASAAQREAIGRRARDYVAAHHDVHTFLRAYDRVCGAALRRSAS